MKPVLIAVAMAIATVALPAVSQQAAYPSKGQTPEQQKTDEAECNTWAIQQSGYNPANPPAVAKAQTAPVTGSGARVGGAAAGAAVGAIGGNDVGNAAAKGAVVGGVVRRNKNRAAASQQNQAAAQQQQAGATAYSNARGACLQGRGYTVK
ncbi:MAG TPA: hypothetical protein VGO25_13620 [Rhodanobacteraceae bacterium]|jgi:hypothetical protein|nr:hypothetical protein [Rhodanobacteraceae bacterium]